mgnify:CR=1 FL=1
MIFKRKQVGDLTWSREYVWGMRLKSHLPEDYKEEVIVIYQNCIDYSCDKEYDGIMAFVTKAFVERNRQLDENRTMGQVKMKWGYLTIYYDGDRDPYLDEIINTASKMAHSTKVKLDEMYGRGGFRRRKVLHPGQN